MAKKIVPVQVSRYSGYWGPNDSEGTHSSCGSIGMVFGGTGTSENTILHSHSRNTLGVPVKNWVRLNVDIKSMSFAIGVAAELYSRDEIFQYCRVPRGEWDSSGLLTSSAIAFSFHE